MRIGDFARLGNTSVRALRFYNETGLLQPLQVDPESGYRHYSPGQIARLAQIHAFQDLGFSLAEIRELLRRDLSPTSLRELMQQRRSELKNQIRDDVARLARIEHRLQELNDGKSLPSPVLVRQTKAAWVVSLREKLRCYEDAEELFQELERRIPDRWLIGERSALWHRCASRGGAIDCEVMRRLKRPVTLPHGLRTCWLPATTIASVFHSGSEDTLSHSYQRLDRWLSSSDFRLRGAKREIYWIAEGCKTDSAPLTEIQYPVSPGAAKRSSAA